MSPEEDAKIDVMITDVYMKLRDKINNRPRSQTYEDLAAASGVSRDYIERVARNKINQPLFSNMVRLWIALVGVNPLEHGFVEIV